MNGHFHGVIQTENERYHVEPAKRFFKDPKFHSIVYAASNVEFKGETCAASPKIRQWMSLMQNSAVKTKEERQRQAQAQSHQGMYEEHLNRKRRALGNNLECRIKVAADHLFSAQIAQEEGRQ